MSDLISRRKAFEYFVTLWECIGTIMDRDEWEDVCMTTSNEIPSAEPDLQPTCNQLAKDTNIPCKDTISRQDAIDMIMGQPPEAHYPSWYAEQIKVLPSAQPDRDIPRKPIEGCSLSRYKKVKEGSCPNCSFFLSHFRFYGEGKHITYCEHCGQAIDWEGWEWDD